MVKGKNDKALGHGENASVNQFLLSMAKTEQDCNRDDAFPAPDPCMSLKGAAPGQVPYSSITDIDANFSLPLMLLSLRVGL